MDAGTVIGIAGVLVAAVAVVFSAGQTKAARSQARAAEEQLRAQEQELARQNVARTAEDKAKEIEFWKEVVDRSDKMYARMESMLDVYSGLMVRTRRIRDMYADYERALADFGTLIAHSEYLDRSENVKALLHKVVTAHMAAATALEDLDKKHVPVGPLRSYNVGDVAVVRKLNVAFRDANMMLRMELPELLSKP